MTVIRKIVIENFRAMKRIEWLPIAGINCLIGPGDSGKSTILDAIDLCLGARRNTQISDADFHRLDVNNPINIAITLGNLNDSLKSIDTYGLYLRGFNMETGEIESEPEAGLETVLTLQLTVKADLDPQWALVSERAQDQGASRNLSWRDRVNLAPTRLGAFTHHNLSWQRGSILNRVYEEKANAPIALAEAARNARATFGDQAQDLFSETLKIVADTAKHLGIPVGETVKAMLDAHAVSFGGGAISLHDENQVPLRSLGLGSTRLLIAGLQRMAANEASMVLVDELEYGLEPHRIIRLLDAVGAKEKDPPLQVFMTTHSPVAVRELSGRQLFVVRSLGDQHEAYQVGDADEIQGTIRLFPDALLAPSVVICEGASEVGFLRGLDQYRLSQGELSITAYGVAVIDGNGSNTFKRAIAFGTMGYRSAVLRDSDVAPDHDLEKQFAIAGGKVFMWQPNRAIEDELFMSLSDDGVKRLLDRAIELKEENTVNEHIKTISQNTKDLQAIKFELLIGEITKETRELLGKASRIRNGWFKSVRAMEGVARDIVGPELQNADAAFRAIVEGVFGWIADDRR